eukprot:288384-Chlamydomonas_euryale.AAC.1
MRDRALEAKEPRGRPVDVDRVDVPADPAVRAAGSCGRCEHVDLLGKRGLWKVRTEGATRKWSNTQTQTLYTGEAADVLAAAPHTSLPPPGIGPDSAPPHLPFLLPRPFPPLILPAPSTPP